MGWTAGPTNSDGVRSLVGILMIGTEGFEHMLVPVLRPCVKDITLRH